jgi:hypothetical protein
MTANVIHKEPTWTRPTKTETERGQAISMHFATGQMLVGKRTEAPVTQPDRAERLPSYLLDYAVFVLDQRARYCQ